MVFKHTQSHHLRLSLVSVGAFLLVMGLAPVSASSANVSYSYQSKNTIPAGSLVSLDPSSKNTIQAANTTNAARILGIVVNSSDSLLAVDSGKGSAQVAISGTAPGLVSDVNGSIKVGDKVAVSPFDGIGMKAGSGTYVIGLAQTAFDTHAKGVQTRTVKDSTGASKQIAIGSININIAAGSVGGGEDQKINSLQKLARSLTGRIIPTGRIIVALLITGVTLIALIVLIYGSVYSTIISIGRNPLAKYAVYRSLTTVLTMAFITAAVAMGVALLLLR